MTLFAHPSTRRRTTSVLQGWRQDRARELHIERTRGQPPAARLADVEEDLAAAEADQHLDDVMTLLEPKTSVRRQVARRDVC